MSPLSNKVNYNFIGSNGKNSSVGKTTVAKKDYEKKVNDKSNTAYGFKNTTNIASKKEMQAKVPISSNKNPFLKKNNNGNTASNGCAYIEGSNRETGAFERNGSGGLKKVTTNFTTTFNKCRGSPNTSNYRNK